jgi:hypothetical protein
MSFRYHDNQEILVIFLILKRFFHQVRKMRIIFHPTPSLTDIADRLGVLLTLTLIAFVPVHAAAAGGNELFLPNSPQYQYNAMDAADQNQRLKSMLDYAKQELPVLLPGLPGGFRDPAQWALNGLRETGNFMSFGLASGDNIDAVASILRPVTALMQPAAPGDASATWLDPAYHHRHGILPTHDAMIVGTHSRQALFDRYMQMDFHPYIAQSYFSAHGYYGAEMTLDLASPADTAHTGKPWGKIVLGYTNGDSNMMDHGRGVDLHGELRFSDTLSLNTGLRQSDSTGNYVLLQWKIATN